MKTKHRTITTITLPIITLAAILSGCERHEQSQSEPSTRSEITTTNLKAKAQETADTTRAAIAQTKDEFVTASNQKLQELDTKIDQLAAASADYKDDAKAQADKVLADLRDQREKARVKLDELKGKSADAWSEVKDGFTVAINELEKAYENAKSKLN